MSKIGGGNYGALMATQSIYAESSSANCAVGTRLPMGDRTFFYGKFIAATAAGLIVSPDYSDAGPMLLADGSLVSMTAAQAELSPIAIAVPAVAGQKFLAVTHASALDNITKNELENGYIVLTDSAGVDECHKIRRNQAWSSSVSDYVEIELWDELIGSSFADATTGVVLSPSLFMNLRAAAVGTDEIPVGVPMRAITANYYAWVQTYGPAGVVTVTDTAFGGADGELAGTGQVAIRDSDGIEPRVGRGITDTTTAGDMVLFYLQLCP